MQTICAIVLCGVLTLAVQPDRDNSNDANSNANLTGSMTSVYALAFHPEEISALPPGAIYVCRAQIMPDANAGHAAKGSGTVPGNQSGCAMEIPFAWQANHPNPAATLSYEVDAVTTDGHVLRSVAREDIPLPKPIAGNVARVELAF